MIDKSRLDIYHDQEYSLNPPPSLFSQECSGGEIMGKKTSQRPWLAVYSSNGKKVGGVNVIKDAITIYKMSETTKDVKKFCVVKFEGKRVLFEFEGN